MLGRGWVRSPGSTSTAASSTSCFCDRCDLLVGLAGVPVIGVERDDGGGLVVTVDSVPEVMGCRADIGDVQSQHLA